MRQTWTRHAPADSHFARICDKVSEFGEAKRLASPPFPRRFRTILSGIRKDGLSPAF